MLACTSEPRQTGLGGEEGKDNDELIKHSAGDETRTRRAAYKCSRRLSWGWGSDGSDDNIINAPSFPDCPDHG